MIFRRSILLALSTLTTALAFQGSSGVIRHTTSLSRHDAFVPSNYRISHTALSETAVPGVEQEEDPLAGMTEEQKANLFQALLRDLQIETVPLLGCDANAVHTMSAALWTTIAELSERDEADKVCLVMEAIPIGALQAFVEDFTVLKTQGRLMFELRELERVSVSLVGKGVGPAFIIETTERTEEEIQVKNARSSVVYDEAKSTAALKSFIDRIVVNEQACPYTKNVDLAAVGLDKQGVPPGPVAYRFDASSDAAAVVGVFWNCVCELLSKPQEEISTTMLSLPAIGPGTSEASSKRFSAVVELISRYLVLFRGDDVFGLVHFHPAYDRTTIEPLDKPAYGHLPPRDWLRPMLKLNGNTDEAENMTDEDLALNDYQRKAPFTAINILRVNQLNAASGAKSIVDLEVAEGVTEKASGINTYSRNAIRLAGVGKDALEAGLQADIAMNE
mmetsp:Transcript_7970/g.11371  ORF Transcript_7970/g.11371 Transcript_7970/m.11371 type:complete len:447 (-) Transcript_7970:145-1485(-)